MRTQGSGRKRTTTNLRRSADDVYGLTDAPPLTEVPDPPEWMIEEGKVEEVKRWLHYAPLAVANKLLTELNLESFELYCVLGVELRKQYRSGRLVMHTIAQFRRVGNEIGFIGIPRLAHQQPAAEEKPQHQGSTPQSVEQPTVASPPRNKFLRSKPE